jgi:hypothetical protein
VKVAPGISHALVPPSVEAEWVSLDGRLREACLWSGQMSRTSRRATVLSSGGESSSLTGTSDHAAGGEVRPLTDPGHYVYEPDDAVVRAHLVTAFAALVDGWLLHPQVAYVSADRLVSTALGTAFEVVDVLPFKEKPLRAALRARGVGSLTIKKRGVAVSPEGLRERLRLRGPNAATVILARTAGSAVALLVDPVANRPLPPNPAAP